MENTAQHSEDQIQALLDTILASIADNDPAAARQMAIRELDRRAVTARQEAGSATAITDEQIHALRADATAVRNTLLAPLCSDALTGSIPARNRLSHILAAA